MSASYSEKTKEAYGVSADFSAADDYVSWLKRVGVELTVIKCDARLNRSSVKGLGELKVTGNTKGNSVLSQKRLRVGVYANKSYDKIAGKILNSGENPRTNA